MEVLKHLFISVKVDTNAVATKAELAAENAYLKKVIAAKYVEISRLTAERNRIDAVYNKIKEQFAEVNFKIDYH